MKYSPSATFLENSRLANAAAKKPLLFNVAG
jgi:hypothetical protein